METNTVDLCDLPNFRVANLPVESPLLYRSSFVDQLTETGAKELHECGVKTIIDLRGMTESKKTIVNSHLPRFYKHFILIKDGSVSRYTYNKLEENTATESDRRRLVIDFLGIDFKLAIFRELSFLDGVRIGWQLFMSYFSDNYSYESEAAKCVLLPKGLGGQHICCIEHCQREMATVLRILSDKENLPALLHCFIGKDRTGLIVMLLESLCGMSQETIIQEYVESHQRTEHVRQSIIDYYAPKGLPRIFAECHEEEIICVMDHILTKYKSVEGYLSSIGLTNEEIEKLRENFS